MPSRTVIVGAGGAGMGAAGQAKAMDPNGEILVYTEYEDAAYSPCGIPYVHGEEIPDFERLFLATKEHYQEQGIDVRYQTRVESVDLGAKKIEVDGVGSVDYDNLVLATGWNYADPGVPGGDLEGLYYVKNIRQAMEWDKVLDTVQVAVVVEAGPLGLEMTTALTHRGIETHLVDSHPWSLSEAADPDIVEPVEQSWTEMGVKMHFNCELREFTGAEGKLRAVQTSEGEIPCDLAVISTHKVPNNRLAEAAGITLGSTGGIVIDERMATSAPHVWAAGDCCEVVHGVNSVPLQGLSGSHAYAQGKVAGTNAAGGNRRYQPVYVPWGMVAGKWMIGGVAYGETLATALGLPYISGVGNGISRARYYPGVKTLRVKVLAEPDTLRLIGAQMVGQEGIKERADFLALAVKTGVTLEDLATMENVYSPPIGALGEPIAAAAQAALASRK
ncbi:MAG: FAD-dependent oxidoreductase [Acidimicrobiales bacterium]